MMLGVQWPQPVVSVEGPCDTDEVWDRYVRPQRWPEWSPHIIAVQTTGSRLVPGMIGVVHGRANARVRFEVIAVDETGAVRSWSWRVSVVGFAFTVDHMVEATDAGTRTAMRVEGFMPIVALYLPIARRALRHLVR